MSISRTHVHRHAVYRLDNPFEGPPPGAQGSGVPILAEVDHRALVQAAGLEVRAAHLGGAGIFGRGFGGGRGGSGLGGGFGGGGFSARPVVWWLWCSYGYPPCFQYWQRRLRTHPVRRTKRSGTSRSPGSTTKGRAPGCSPRRPAPAAEPERPPTRGDQGFLIDIHIPFANGFIWRTGQFFRLYQRSI